MNPSPSHDRPVAGGRGEKRRSIKFGVIGDVDSFRSSIAAQLATTVTCLGQFLTAKKQEV
jgi:hypothetical protein